MKLHKVVVTFLLLERSGFSKRKTAVYAFLAAAITTPLGTLVSYPFISRITKPTLGNMLAISSGALAHVGTSHLLLEVEKENK